MRCKPGNSNPRCSGPSRLSKLRLHPDPAVAKRAIQIINEVGAGTNAAKDETIAKLLPLIESKAGDAVKGKFAFATACSICQRCNNDGKEVGPVLDGIGVQGTNELLISIIDPSRVVDNEHRTWSIALKNGTFAVGIIARENDRTVTLHLPGDQWRNVHGRGAFVSEGADSAFNTRIWPSISAPSVEGWTLVSVTPAETQAEAQRACAVARCRQMIITRGGDPTLVSTASEILNIAPQV